MNKKSEDLGCKSECLILMKKYERYYTKQHPLISLINRVFPATRINY